MAGLGKPKKYDWKDSNLALFGSDTEKSVKKSSAETEPAWQGAGQEVGLQIWRIVKFKVEHWDKEDYGTFFSGDSYIILNTDKDEESDELLYDLHFWIGKSSTQDEYGTAAYKTVELDTYLDDKPVQHREVQGHESGLFKSYFPGGIHTKEGGADSGFRHVVPQQYEPRLLHFNGKGKNITSKEVPLHRSRLDSSDVFILDKGLEIYQWNGKTCDKDEKFKALQYVQSLKSERGGKPKVETLDEGDISSNHTFYTYLIDVDAKDDDDDENGENLPKKLLKLSDSSGKMKMSLVGEGESVNQKLLDSSDVFILDIFTDTLKEVFVWIGKNASADENHNALPYAHNYLKETTHPLSPVTAVGEGSSNKKALERFQAALTA